MSWNDAPATLPRRRAILKGPQKCGRAPLHALIVELTSFATWERTAEDVNSMLSVGIEDVQVEAQRPEDGGHDLEICHQSLGFEGVARIYDPRLH